MGWWVFDGAGDALATKLILLGFAVWLVLQILSVDQFDRVAGAAAGFARARRVKVCRIVLLYFHTIRTLAESSLIHHITVR